MIATAPLTLCYSLPDPHAAYRQLICHMIILTCSQAKLTFKDAAPPSWVATLFGFAVRQWHTSCLLALLLDVVPRPDSLTVLCSCVSYRLLGSLGGSLIKMAMAKSASCSRLVCINKASFALLQAAAAHWIQAQMQCKETGTCCNRT